MRKNDITSGESVRLARSKDGRYDNSNSCKNKYDDHKRGGRGNNRERGGYSNRGNKSHYDNSNNYTSNPKRGRYDNNNRRGRGSKNRRGRGGNRKNTERQNDGKIKDQQRKPSPSNEGECLNPLNHEYTPCEKSALSAAKTEVIYERGKTLARLLADSGATEHLTNFRLIFKTYDKRIYEIKCANGSKGRLLRTERFGDVICRINKNKCLNLKNVIWADNLSENLISLRKFVDQGLSIYLDDKCIDIYDPKSNESLLSEIYKKPFWILEFEIDKLGQANFKPDKINAYLMMRSMTERKRMIENDEYTKNEPNETINEISEFDSKSNSNEETEKELETPILENCSDFDVTVRDRNIMQIDQSLSDEKQNCSVEFESGTKQINDTAMLWHVRMGHASVEYLKKLQEKYPEIKDLKECKFYESIRNCEICLI